MVHVWYRGEEGAKLMPGLAFSRDDLPNVLRAKIWALSAARLFLLV